MKHLQRFTALIPLLLLIACQPASAQSNDRDRVTGTITANGNTDIVWQGNDKVTAMAFFGDFDSGDITVLYEVVKDSGEYVAFTEADAKTDDFGFQFKAPSSNIRITAANIASAADITYAMRVVTE